MDFLKPLQGSQIKMPDLVPFFLTFNSVFRIRIKFIFVLCQKKKKEHRNDLKKNVYKNQENICDNLLWEHFLCYEFFIK